jgi:hypothetical protein
MGTRARMAVILAAVGILAALGGWIVALFGPRPLLMVGTGVSLACIVVGVVARAATGDAPAPADVAGWARLRLRLDAACLVFFVLAVGVVFAMLVTCADGVPNFPAFAERPRYELNSHGRTTPVSRARYVLASVNASSALHLALWAGNLAVLYGGLFGALPSFMSRERRTTTG